MITGPKYKICRRLGSSVYEKCQNQKFQLAQAKRKPVRRRGSISNYGLQLLEKQRVRYAYGLKEHQFASVVGQALAKTGAPADNLYSLLERRLDNVVYRLGLAQTRAFARQLVTHGHVLVNGRKLNVPSHQLKESDVITLRAGTEKKNLFEALKARVSEAQPPTWLSLDKSKLAGTVSGEPKAAEGDNPFDLSVVVQFYTR